MKKPRRGWNPHNKSEEKVPAPRWWIYSKSEVCWTEDSPEDQNLVFSSDTFFNQKEEQHHLGRVLQDSGVVVRHQLLRLRHKNRHWLTGQRLNEPRYFQPHAPSRTRSSDWLDPGTDSAAAERCCSCCCSSRLLWLSRTQRCRPGPGPARCPDSPSAGLRRGRPGDSRSERISRKQTFKTS